MNENIFIGLSLHSQAYSLQFDSKIKSYLTALNFKKLDAHILLLLVSAVNFSIKARLK